MRIIRINRHPADSEVVVLSTPPEMSTEMGKFEPARYVPELRAYVAHNNAIPALYRFARHADAHVLDERVTAGERRPAHECAHCGQPGSANHPPRHCPGCGHSWEPVTYLVEEHEQTLTACTHCGTKVAGRFPRCGHCGAVMVYPRAKAMHLARVKLDEPLPLGQAIAENPRLQPEPVQ